MMNFLRYTLIFSLSILFFTSCSDDDSDEVVDTPPYEAIEAGTVQATVFEEVFNSSSVNALNTQDNTIRINASAVTSGIAFNLTASAEGSYPIGGTMTNFLEYSDVDSDGGGFNLSVFTSSEQDDASGTIEILSLDTGNQTISGTFSGTLILDTDPSMTLVIEDGLFNQIPF